MCTPMTTAFFESKGTPRGTPSSKSDGTPMCKIKYQVSSEDVYPDKCGSMENVQGQQDVSSKSKFPMSLTNDENEEDVKNDEEVKEDDDDVCDSMTRDVGSSYKFSEVNMQNFVKTSIEGEFDDEPWGNVSERSRSLRFRHSKA